MIVVDASALAAFILKEPGWRSLVEYVRYCLSLDHAVKEVISVEDALRLFNMLSSLLNVNIILEPEQLYLSKAFRIALDYGLTVYDALYIALAKEKKPAGYLNGRWLCSEVVYRFSKGEEATAFNTR